MLWVRLQAEGKVYDRSTFKRTFKINLEQLFLTRFWPMLPSFFAKIRGGSRAAVTSKMGCFVIKVNGWNGFKPLNIITKCSILDVAAVLDPPLKMINHFKHFFHRCLTRCQIFPKKIIKMHLRPNYSNVNVCIKRANE